MLRVYTLTRRNPSADEGYDTVATYVSNARPNQHIIEMIANSEFHLDEITPTKIIDLEDWEDKLAAELALG